MLEAHINKKKDKQEIKQIRLTKQNNNKYPNIYQTFKLVVLLMLLMFSLAACGKDDSKNKKTETTEATSTDAHATTAVTTEAPIDEPKMDEAGFYVVDDYVKTTEIIVNVRTTPSVDAPIYVLLELGEVLNRTGYNDEWTRILMDNTSFYVSSKFLEETEAPAKVDVPDNPDDPDTNENLNKKIVIDAGNQASLNAATEPIGPNSEETKICATVGKTGTATGIKEYELNSIYATKLKAELENRGYEVILTRENEQTNMSNKERAEFANLQNAGIFIRISMNYSVNTELSGAMAVCMTSDTPYNSQVYEDSYKLSTRLLQGVTETTGATNSGIFETDQMTMVNWSQIPVTVIKPGYLSNERDEQNLQSEDYINSVVDGIANGVDYYYSN